MKQRVTALVLIGVLIFYVLLVGSRGVIAINDGRPTVVVLGVAVLAIPVVGVWYIWRELRFGFTMQQLARELEAEGALPADELERTADGRIARDSADEVFEKRKAETEAAPEDWRAWYRLAVAYSDARDNARGRRAMLKAIRLHRAERT
ncbi:hypothetical protein [Yinghuangia seranimata]|uniref:hypothetical protein n=1 Tax=Yinghuangia seranimata TaxID=408067 RepID=UPI00248AE95F|nr:hypothetical protein [Yinghuangia seranimata]MDI2132487.1 hypothetical protein [Yinghuangia seranimata]